MNNVARILSLNFTWSFLVVQAVMVPFYRANGLSFEQIGIIGSVFSFCLLALDLPTGYVADAFGRRGALVVASVFKGLGGTLLWWWPEFHGFILAFVFIGIGNSLFSGTDVALLYDELEDSTDAARALASRFQWSQLGAATSAIVGGFLAHRSLESTIAINGVLAWTSLVLALTLRAPPTARPRRMNHLAHFASSMRRILTLPLSTRALMLHRVAFSGLLLLQTAQLQIFWTALGVPLAWFGVLWAVHALIGVICSRATVRWQSRVSMRALLTLLTALLATAFLGSALAPWIGVGGAVIGLLFEVERGLFSGTVSAEFNRRLPAEHRAIGNSLVSMGSRLVFVVLAPVAGAVVDRGGLPPLFTGLAVISLVAGLSTTRLFLRTNASEFLEDAGARSA